MAAKHLFLSYSTDDKKFADKLQARLEAAGYEVFRDSKDGTAGPLDRQLEERIQQADALVLVFSENSVCSPWVEWEASVAQARERERRLKDRKLKRKKGPLYVLCPIALDDSWKDADWRGPLKFQIQDYTILDFSKPRQFDSMFDRLHDGLQRWYGQ